MFTADEHLTLSRIVAELQAGATKKAVAQQFGMAESTLRQWLDTPTGRQIIAEYEHDMRERTNRIIASGMGVALKTLLKEMNEADRSADRIRAATAFTSLHDRHVVLTGPDGGPIQVSGHVDALMERIETMRERNIDAIEAQLVDDDDSD